MERYEWRSWQSVTVIVYCKFKKTPRVKIENYPECSENRSKEVEFFRPLSSL